MAEKMIEMVADGTALNGLQPRTTRGGIRLGRGMLLIVMSLTLAACAANREPPAPVEDRGVDVDRQVREPARQDSEGVQVRPLQNPAVQELLADASVAESAGDYQQAEALLERGLRVQPRDPELLQRMAEIKLEQRQYEQALSFAVRSFDVGPRVGELCARNWRTISVARRYLGDRSGASEAERRVETCMSTPRPSL